MASGTQPCIQRDRLLSCRINLMWFTGISSYKHFISRPRLLVNFSLCTYENIKMKRSPWLGYSIAPFTAPLLYGIIILFFPAVYEKEEFSAEVWFLSIALYVFVSYVICFIVGVPLIILLKKIKKLTFTWLAFIGSCLYALIVNFIILYVMKPTILGNIYIIVLQISLTGLAMGMLIVTVFSYLAGITWRSTRPATATPSGPVN